MTLNDISYGLFYVSLLVFLLVFFVNPFLLGVLAFFKRPVQTGKFPIQNLEVSMIVVTQGDPKALEEKINNLLNLNYPKQLLQYVFYLDGADSKVMEIIREKRIANLTVLHSPSQIGKNSALNLAAKECKGDILAFSDADVMISADTLNTVVKRFSEEKVGGVCCRIEILNESGKLIQAQKDYLSFDRFIKSRESDLGSISTNSGAMYAIRRKLFRPFPLMVTDDFFACLSVNQQGFRFVYETDAVVSMKASSRNPKHEIQRRRRIVCRSLKGVYLMKSLLNPYRHGFFSISLFFNKVLRRFIPFFLIFLYVSSGLLSCHHAFIGLFFILQSICYFFAFAFGMVPALQKTSGVIHRLAGACYYFCLGNWGTMLGVMDFFRGREYVSWKTVLE